MVWERVVIPGGPSPRAEHATCIVSQSLYLFGGYNGSSCLNDLWILDLGTTSHMLLKQQGNK